MTFGSGNSLTRHQLLNCSRNSLLSFSQSVTVTATAAHCYTQNQAISKSHNWFTYDNFNITVPSVCLQYCTFQPTTEHFTNHLPTDTPSRRCDNHTHFIHCYCLCMLYYPPITNIQCTSHTCKHILQCIKSLMAEETTLCLINRV